MKVYKYLKYIFNHVEFENIKMSSIPNNVSIGKYSRVGNYTGGRIDFGDNVTICRECKINSCGGSIKLGKNTQIGDRCVITGQAGVEVGESVLFADDIKIIANEHIYNDISIPIMYQGCTQENKNVYIGEGTWIGIGTIILGGTRIGRNCVIGAGSVVKGNFPNYSVIVGNPARVIKRFTNCSWERV